MDIAWWQTWSCCPLSCHGALPTVAKCFLQPLVDGCAVFWRGYCFSSPRAGIWPLVAFTLSVSISFGTKKKTRSQIKFILVPGFSVVGWSGSVIPGSSFRAKGLQSDCQKHVSSVGWGGYLRTDISNSSLLSFIHSRLLKIFSSFEFVAWVLYLCLSFDLSLRAHSKPSWTTSAWKWCQGNCWLLLGQSELERYKQNTATVSRIGLMESCTCRRGGPPPTTTPLPGMRMWLMVGALGLYAD